MVAPWRLRIAVGVSALGVFLGGCHPAADASHTMERDREIFASILDTLAADTFENQRIGVIPRYARTRVWEDGIRRIELRLDSVVFEKDDAEAILGAVARAEREVLVCDPYLPLSYYCEGRQGGHGEPLLVLSSVKGGDEGLFTVFGLHKEALGGEVTLSTFSVEVAWDGQRARVAAIRSTLAY